ncbi:MAG: hypothetical protein KKH44_07450, partial [Bacteroidetes bacterium]|nr:hypothetical protein [Bacteroidota bacterium]
MTKLTQPEIETLFRKNEKLFITSFQQVLNSYNKKVLSHRPIELQDIVQECMIEFFYLLRDKYDAEQSLLGFFRGHAPHVVRKVMKRVCHSSHYCRTTTLAPKGLKGQDHQGRSKQVAVDDNTFKGASLWILLSTHNNKQRLYSDYEYGIEQVKD